MFYAAAHFIQDFVNDNKDKASKSFYQGMIEWAQSIFIAIFAMMMGAMSSGQSQQFGPDVGKAKAAACNIFGIMDLQNEINAMDLTANTSKKKVDPATFKGEIEFQDVWFRYPTRRNDWILKGLSMKISKNETVALVGESGCGKSTTVALILRFYDVNEGRILIDGVDIKEWDIVSLRKAMGLVMQEPTLFSYTISENILYGLPDATNTQIREASHIANALEFIESSQIANAFDEQAGSLLTEMQKNDTYLKKKMGEEKYEEAKKILEKVQKEEEKKGEF